MTNVNDINPYFFKLNGIKIFTFITFDTKTKKFSCVFEINGTMYAVECDHIDECVEVRKAYIKDLQEKIRTGTCLN